jgi:hypothetical protein
LKLLLSFDFFIIHGAKKKYRSSMDIIIRGIWKKIF